MNEVASVAINEFTLKYVTTNALKEPSITPKPTPPRTLKRMFPVAFSILSANNGATTKIAEMEISKLPDIDPVQRDLDFYNYLKQDAPDLVLSGDTARIGRLTGQRLSVRSSGTTAYTARHSSTKASPGPEITPPKV